MGPRSSRGIFVISARNMGWRVEFVGQPAVAALDVLCAQLQSGAVVSADGVRERASNAHVAVPEPLDLRGAALLGVANDDGRGRVRVHAVLSGNRRRPLLLDRVAARAAHDVPRGRPRGGRHLARGRRDLSAARRIPEPPPAVGEQHHEAEQLERHVRDGLYGELAANRRQLRQPGANSTGTHFRGLRLADSSKLAHTICEYAICRLPVAHFP